jgi:hypothetical protein
MTYKVGEDLPGIPTPTAARTWAKIEERMRYVFALFRKFHDIPEVFSTPYPEVETPQIRREFREEFRLSAKLLVVFLARVSDEKATGIGIMSP